MPSEGFFHISHISHKSGEIFYRMYFSNMLQTTERKTEWILKEKKWILN